jgi:hypothetical protein
LARDQFAALYPDNEWLLGVCLASEAAARLGDVHSAETLYEKLRPYAGRHAIGQAEGSVGTVDRYLGLLSITLGHLEAAEDHLTSAIAANEAMGATPWAAHARHELAGVLRLRGGVENRARAEGLEAEALATARRLDMTALRRALGDTGDGQPPLSIATRGEVVDSPPADEHSAPHAPRQAEFRREGEFWTVRFAADEFRLRDSKGLHYLARLLASPGSEFHAMDLAQQSSGASRTPTVDDGLTVDTMPDAGAMLDQEAKEAYRNRLDDLRDTIDEAEAHNDGERAARAREEMDFLAAQLASGLGLGGRDRKAASASERARLSVTRAIRSALQRLAAHDRDLGDHLDVAIRTGTYCSYRPDPEAAVHWTV